MIKESELTEILSLYKRHGWTLRRVLMSPEFEKSLGSKRNVLFRDADMRSSNMDGAWFSRLSNPENETWELRLLTSTPFALLDVLSKTATETEREEALTRVEEKMSKFVAKQIRGH